MIFVILSFFLFFSFLQQPVSLLLVKNSVVAYVLFDILSLFVPASLNVYCEDKDQELGDSIIQDHCVRGRG